MITEEEMVERLRQIGYLIEYVPKVRVPYNEANYTGSIQQSYRLEDVYEVYTRTFGG